MVRLIRTIINANAEHAAKHDKKLRLWRVEQAERDEKRDKEQAERDAKREDELRQWREEQNSFL
ncbi:hypothetical protein H4R24_003131 [Coemansia sp. RSA 988]|nr:hypothetical protein H4R24_003131 [Coemansia sp. RSA 988]